MAVKRLPRDPQFLAQRGDIGFRHAHRRLGEAQFARCHLETAPTVAAPCAGRGEPGLGPLDDQFPLELRQGCEKAEHEAAVRGGRVNRGARAGENLQSDAAPGQVMDEIDQMTQSASEAVELPRDERVARAQTLQANLEPRPIVAPPGSVILVEPGTLDPGGDQGVALQVEDLRAVRFGNPHVADQHVTQTPGYRMRARDPVRGAKSVTRPVTLPAFRKRSGCGLIQRPDPSAPWALGRLQ